MCFVKSDVYMCFRSQRRGGASSQACDVTVTSSVTCDWHQAGKEVIFRGEGLRFSGVLPMRDHTIVALMGDAGRERGPERDRGREEE